MITSASLKAGLNTIFFGADTTKYKYIVPIRGGFFTPAALDKSDHVSTWIGYRILEITPRARAYKNVGEINEVVRVDFRITGLGPGSEEFITSTLLWENRVDVKDVFEGQQEAQVMYDRRRVYTHPIEQEGFGDDMLWVTDMHAMTYLKRELTTQPWFPH